MEKGTIKKKRLSMKINILSELKQEPSERMLEDVSQEKVLLAKAMASMLTTRSHLAKVAATNEAILKLFQQNKT